MIGQTRTAHRAAWTAEADAELTRRLQAGELLGEVARAIGRTQEACRSRANILGVPVRSTLRKGRVGFHGEGAPMTDAAAGQSSGDRDP